MAYELKFNYLISHDLKRQIYHVKNQICFFYKFMVILYGVLHVGIWGVLSVLILETKLFNSCSDICYVSMFSKMLLEMFKRRIEHSVFRKAVELCTVLKAIYASCIVSIKINKKMHYFYVCLFLDWSFSVVGSTTFTACIVYTAIVCWHFHIQYTGKIFGSHTETAL